MKNLILMLIGLFAATASFAQWGEDEMDGKAKFRERIFTGGGFGFSASSYSTNLSISPLIGYRITDKLGAGIQFQYQYNKYKKPISLSTNDYGVSPFVRYMVYAPIFLHAEYEYLNYVSGIDQNNKKVRDAFNSFMAGGGFFQPLGSKAGFFFLVLYNFSYESPYSGEVTPYNSPWVIRGGVTVGF